MENGILNNYLLSSFSKRKTEIQLSYTGELIRNFHPRTLICIKVQSCGVSFDLRLSATAFAIKNACVFG